MLNKFNQKISDIIFEAYDVSPKFIDKDFQCSFNKVDLFTSKVFFKGTPSSTFLSDEFVKLLFSKININDIKKETSVIIYIPIHSLVYTGIISPTPGDRHEIILLNSWKSDKIPNIETTGQKRIIL